MSDLTERIARGHATVLDGNPAIACSCGWHWHHGASAPDHTGHVAEVTEAAVREQIAADIKAAPLSAFWSNTSLLYVRDAVRIARGDA